MSRDELKALRAYKAAVASLRMAYGEWTAARGVAAERRAKTAIREWTREADRLYLLAPRRSSAQA